jgi:hypothetical protein
MIDRKNKLIGIIISLVGAILGIFGTWILFILGYEPLQAAMLPMPPQGGVGTDLIAILFLPIVGDFAIIGGVLYTLSALGFYSDAKWAFKVAIIANIISLQATFWPFIPYITVGLTPVHLILFIPNLVFYFALLQFVGESSWSQIILALLTGMAFVMTFMNGVASTKHIIDVVQGRMDTGGPIYAISQRINWIGAFGFAAVTAGILLYQEKEWVRYTGIGSAILALLGGLPLAIINTLEKGDISMFFFSPILCIPLLIIFLWPSLWDRLILSD